MMARGIRKLMIVVATAALSLAAPAAAAGAWGAIAVDPQTGKAGVGVNEPTKKAAQNEAERDCPGKCRQIIIVLNKCGALGVTEKGRFVGGFASSKKEAIKEARAKAGPGGKLIAFVCS